MKLPLLYLGEGQFQTPHGFKVRADKELVIGELLPWAVEHPRSQKSHAHYFASIGDAWSNLPEALAGDFPSSEHLRKYALIKAGYCTVNKVVCRDNGQAVAAAALMKGMDDFAVYDLTGSDFNKNVLTVYRASSQSVKAMGSKEFQQSKDDVLTIISGMIGADVTERQAA